MIKISSKNVYLFSYKSEQDTAPKTIRFGIWAKDLQRIMIFACNDKIVNTAKFILDPKSLQCFENNFGFTLRDNFAEISYFGQSLADEVGTREVTPYQVWEYSQSKNLHIASNLKNEKECLIKKLKQKELLPEINPETLSLSYLEHMLWENPKKYLGAVKGDLKIFIAPEGFNEKSD